MTDPLAQIPSELRAYSIVYTLAFVVAFGVVAALGKPAIELLRKLSFQQKAYEDAPGTHAVKTGTPTMGGVLFAVALVVLAICAVALGFATIYGPPVAVLELAGLGIACGLIGFIDDYASIVRGRNKGLGGREKFAATALVAAIFLAAFALGPGATAVHRLAFGSWSFGVPVWVWLSLSFVAILSTTHAVNLTDGLDGLASGTIVPPLLLMIFLSFAIMRYAIGAAHDVAICVGVVDAVMLGAVFGFLVYNRHPARVFMGDTGSLLLGGVLAGSAIMLDEQLLLPIVGAVFAAEALSVIIQVGYFKRTGKRIFRMSPLHHHFELAGWPETKVTARFWLASAFVSLLGLAIALLSSVAV